MLTYDHHHQQTLFTVYFVVLCFLALNFGSSVFLPPGTTASRWTGNVVLCYVDSRSTDVSIPTSKNMFHWSWDRFARLLAYYDRPSDQKGGEPVDLFFDSFLFIGYEWYDDKSFWPGINKPMNKTDWFTFLNMQLNIGVANLERAAANISTILPFSRGSHSCANSGIITSAILTIPYPDPRQEHFGAIEDNGTSLNFSKQDDRIAAVNWYVSQAWTAWNEMQFNHVTLQGFYWFMEKIEQSYNDSELVRTTSASIKSISPSLNFAWIPYFQPGDHSLPKWKELGFDFVTLQPNFAFNNVSAGLFVQLLS